MTEHILPRKIRPPAAMARHRRTSCFIIGHPRRTSLGGRKSRCRDGGCARRGSVRNMVCGTGATGGLPTRAPRQGTGLDKPAVPPARQGRTEFIPLLDSSSGKRNESRSYAATPVFPSAPRRPGRCRACRRSRSNTAAMAVNCPCKSLRLSRSLLHHFGRGPVGRRFALASFFCLRRHQRLQADVTRRFLRAVSASTSISPARST